MEADAAIAHGGNRRLGQRLHAHEPLLREAGLHRHIAALAIADRVHIGLDGRHQTELLQARHHRPATDVTVHPAEVRTGPLVHRPVVVHHVQHGEVVTLSAGVVVGVVRRRHLDRAGAELRVHEGVGDQRDLAVADRQQHRLPDAVAVARIVGMHRHRGIAEHGLRPRGGHGDEAAAILEGVLEVPELALVLLVDHFLIRERRAALRAPVDDAVALVDQAFLVETDEDLLHRRREAGVQGEAFALPVAGRADGAQLLDDLAAVRLLPLPHPLQELLPAQVTAAEALAVLEELLNLGLRGDAGVVRARHPAGLATAHLLPPDQDVLQRVVQNMAKRQYPGDVRGRNNDRERRFRRTRCGAEVPARFPLRIPGLLDLGRSVGLGHRLLTHPDTLLTTRSALSPTCPATRDGVNPAI